MKNKIYFYLINIFWLLTTFLLSFIFYPLILLKKGKLKKPKRILVIPPVKIGDLTCATSIFREIKKALPQSYIGVVLLAGSGRRGTSFQLLKNNPHIDKIILPDKKNGLSIVGILKLIKRIRREKYNWSFVLPLGVIEKIIVFWAFIPNRVVSISKYASLTSKILNFTISYKLEMKLHKLALRHYLNLLKFIGIKNFNEKKEIFVNLEEEKKASQFLKKNNLNSNNILIGIAVTAGNKIKEWPKEKFAELADKLVKKFNAKIIFVGSPSDKKDISFVQSRMNYKSIDSSQDLNVIEFAALSKYFNLFISVDTGPLYIANAMGISVVDIAGPIDIYEQPPLGDKCEIVQKNLPCVPCSFVMKTARFCKEGHLRCIKDIMVEDVFRAVKKII